MRRKTHEYVEYRGIDDEGPSDFQFPRMIASAVIVQAMRDIGSLWVGRDMTMEGHTRTARSALSFAFGDGGSLPVYADMLEMDADRMRDGLIRNYADMMHAGSGLDRDRAQKALERIGRYAQGLLPHSTGANGWRYLPVAGDDIPPLPSLASRLDRIVSAQRERVGAALLKGARLKVCRSGPNAGTARWTAA